MLVVTTIANVFLAPQLVSYSNTAYLKEDVECLHVLCMALTVRHAKLGRTEATLTTLLDCHHKVSTCTKRRPNQ